MNCWWPKTPGEKQKLRTQEECQSQQGIIWVASFIFQLRVLKFQRGVKPAVQAVCHGNDTMWTCTCTLTYCFTCYRTKPNHSSLFLSLSPFSNSDHRHRVDGPVDRGDDGAGRERQDLERDLEGGLRSTPPRPSDRAMEAKNMKLFIQRNRCDCAPYHHHPMKP